MSMFIHFISTCVFFEDAVSCNKHQSQNPITSPTLSYGFFKKKQMVIVFNKYNKRLTKNNIETLNTPNNNCTTCTQRTPGASRPNFVGDITED